MLGLINPAISPHGKVHLIRATLPDREYTFPYAREGITQPPEWAPKKQTRTTQDVPSP